MATTTTTTRNVGEAICKAWQSGTDRRDPDLLANLYAHDCEHVIINRNSPPSRPTVLKGREAMRKMFADVFAREMTHCLENAVIGEDRIAFHKSCQYQAAGDEGAPRITRMYPRQFRGGG